MTPPDSAHYNFSIGGARTRCRDYINPTFYALYKGCLTINRYMLSSQLINYTLFADGDYGNASFPFQLGVCVASFSCSLTTAAAPPPPLGKRAMEQDTPTMPLPPLRTQEQWGFRSTRGNDGDNPLNIKEPRAKSQFWSWMHHTVKNGAAAYLPTFLEARGLLPAKPVADS